MSMVSNPEDFGSQKLKDVNLPWVRSSFDDYVHKRNLNPWGAQPSDHWSYRCWYAENLFGLYNDESVTVGYTRCSENSASEILGWSRSENSICYNQNGTSWLHWRAIRPSQILCMHMCTHAQNGFADSPKRRVCTLFRGRQKKSHFLLLHITSNSAAHCTQKIGVICMIPQHN
jgi:hypothetical protein